MDDARDRSWPCGADTIDDVEVDRDEARSLAMVGRYVVLDSIGMGGMGLVCAAYDPKLNRKIALKLLRNSSSGAASSSGRNRLFREAQALAKLSHPNVVTVHDVDVWEGQVYIAMEFVEGTTLGEWLHERPRTWREILHKFVLAGRGLAAAHQADIVHRDFKPSNVLISKSGDVRVADFGVAKDRDRGARADPKLDAVELERKRRLILGGGRETAEEALIEEIQTNASVDLTVAGRMVGTPAYMAPEQHMGLRVGPYTDQYSFCLSLYEALYGQLPFAAGDRREQLIKMTEGRISAPAREPGARPVPSWVFKILARGLRPHSSERWPSMAALLIALERDPAARRRRLVALAVGVLGLTTGAIAAVYVRGQPGPTDPCLALGDEVETHWNPATRATIHAAFMATHQAYAADTAERVGERLDQWAEDWRSTKIAVCEATRDGAQSDELLDARVYCLDQRAREVTAMLAVFAEADDEVVEHSVAAAHALANPDTCATVRVNGEVRDRRLDRRTLARASAIDAELDRAKALAALEKFDESLALQTRLVVEARAAAHPWTLMRALFELSKSQAETGDFEGSEASLAEVVELAATLADLEQEAEAWNRLIFYIGAQRSRIAAGNAWALAARSSLIRAGSGPALESHYEGALAALALADGALDRAIEHYDAALGLARAEYGDDHPATIRVLMNRAVALARADRYDAAEASLRTAVSRTRAVYGPSHPRLATVYLNLGFVYLKNDRFEAAEAALRASLAITEAQFGPTAAALGKPLHALGKVARELGRLEESLATLERATAIFRAAFGENSNEVAAAVTDLGVTQHLLGRYDAAQASFDRVEAIYTSLYPDGHRHLGGLFERRCRMLIDARRYAEAVAACERGLEVGERMQLSASWRLELGELAVVAATRLDDAATLSQVTAERDRLRDTVAVNR